MPILSRIPGPFVAACLMGFAGLVHQFFPDWTVTAVITAAATFLCTLINQFWPKPTPTAPPEAQGQARGAAPAPTPRSAGRKVWDAFVQ